MRIRSLVLLIASLLMFALATTAAAEGDVKADAWVLRNVNVVAMDGQPVRMGQDVTIEGRRIVAIAPTGDIDA